jgi:branched-chain amino acid transport system substrate-binding protein
MNFLKAFLFTLIILSSFVQATLAQDNENFKLGIVLPLTSPANVHGVPIQRAIQLASLKLDSGSSKRIELIFEDDAFKATNTVTAVQKLIHVDKVNAIIVFGTTMGNAVVDIIEKAKIPFLSLNVNRIVVKDKKYSFLMMPSIESMMTPLINEVKSRKYASIYQVASIQESCLLQAEIFKGISGLNIIDSSEVLPAEVSFTDLASRIKSKSPEAVFLSTLIPQGALIAKKLREMGYKGDLFAGPQESSLSELALSNNALLNAYLVSGDDRLGDSLFINYKNQYGVDPREESDWAIYAYNSFHLLLEGIKSGDVVKFLSELRDFESTLGPISADGERGFTFPVGIKKFTKNGFEYVN